MRDFCVSCYIFWSDIRTDLNEKEHVDALELQIRAEPAAREEVEVGEAPVPVYELTVLREF